MQTSHTTTPKAGTASKSAITIPVPAAIARELAKHKVTPRRFVKDMLEAVAATENLDETLFDIYRRDRPGWIEGLVVIAGKA